MTLSQSMARFLVGLDIAKVPPAVAEKTRVCLLNGLGIGLGCFDTPYAPVAREAAIAMEGETASGATLLGDGRKSTVAGACLANAALFHGRAQEDACGAAHFGTILLPLAIALIEARRLPLDRLLPALLAGYEAGGHFEKFYAGKTTPGGFRASPVYGTVAAAATAAKLLALDEKATAAALGNATSFAFGILQSFADGTDEWRYQVGMAGQMGLAAAELARAGSISAPHAFEGKSGYIKSFAKTECDADGLAALLGKEWAVLRVAFKPYPVCAFNQTPVTAALALRDKLKGKAIGAVRVRMNPYECGYAGMDAVGPFNSVSGTLMSIPFCIALTLVHGVPDMGRMTTYDDRAVNDLIPRIKLVADETVPTLSCVIEATSQDGAKLVQDQKMTAQDYAYDRGTVSALIRRIGREQGVAMEAYDRLEAFVDRLPGGDIGDVVGAFSLLPRLKAAA
ncbi:MAG: MmgE/PrpD family protein [Alphaproteobacteria bacterium]|nr:MmgE/PrpD family protein [Alphaproteobacteria bacterium]